MIAKILIVDDDANIRTMLRDLLEHNHHEVLEATDGAQAFAMAEKHRPHLIIMDIVMPGLYGTTATKKIHDYKGLKDTPILIFSGSTDQSVIEKVGMRMDEDHLAFLKKPCDAKVILETVRRMLPEGGYTQ